jgi:hypothetical protein
LIRAELQGEASRLRGAAARLSASLHLMQEMTGLERSCYEFMASRAFDDLVKVAGEIALKGFVEEAEVMRVLLEDTLRPDMGRQQRREDGSPSSKGNRTRTII